MDNIHQHGSDAQAAQSQQLSLFDDLPKDEGEDSQSVGRSETAAANFHPHYIPGDVKTMTRIDTFREIQKGTPTNEYGLPIYMLRADLFDTSYLFLSVDEQLGLQSAASIDIQYHEGFPAFETGESIWARMEHEPEDAYRLFQEYIKQGDRYGVRRLELLSGDLPPELAYIQNLTMETLREYHCYYYWSARVKAFDLFQRAAWEKMRERRIMTVQDQHFMESEKLLTQLRQYFNYVDPDSETGQPLWLEELTPKVALDFMEKLTKLQRVSIGLNAHGLSNADLEGAPARGASVEVTLRQIAKAGADPEANKNASQGAGLDLLLADPDTALLAQQLIIKVNSKGHEHSSGGGGGPGASTALPPPARNFGEPSTGEHLGAVPRAVDDDAIPASFDHKE